MLFKREDPKTLSVIWEIQTLDVGILHEARTVKPNSCICSARFPQEVINLFANAVAGNSHPASLERKPNPLSRSEHPDLQNCSSSSSSPQLPTNKTLPKSTPPPQSYFKDCVYGSCRDSPEAPFNTKFRYSVNPGTRRGHRQDVLCRAAPPDRLGSGQAAARHAQAAPEAGCPPSRACRGSLGAAWAHRRGPEPGCGQGGADSSQCRFPSFSKPHPQAAFQQDEFREKLIK